MWWMCLGSALAASLDLIEVGGPWGTPTAKDGTAVWWNPAGISQSEGLQIHIEAAPTFAELQFERAAPKGGEAIYQRRVVIPYLGATKRLGDFGIGAGLVVPTGKGAGAEDDVPTSFSMIEGSTRAIHFLTAGSYRFSERFSLGATVGLAAVQWTTRFDSETITTLSEALGSDHPYTDAMFETFPYANRVELGPLNGWAPTGSLGVHWQPAKDWVVAATAMPGLNAKPKGDGTISMGCPDESDKLGRFALERDGLCDAVLDVAAQATFKLPPRVHLGVALPELGGLQTTIMGAWVGWSVHQDLVVEISEAESRNLAVSGADRVNQTKVRARDAGDTFWAGVDIKRRFGSALVGTRVIYDQGAVPDETLGVNHFDADTVLWSGLLGLRINEQLEAGLSATQFFAGAREVEESGFHLTVDEASRAADRFHYPHGNGVYTASIQRLGIQVRVTL